MKRGKSHNGEKIVKIIIALCAVLCLCIFSVLLSRSVGNVFSFFVFGACILSLSTVAFYVDLKLRGFDFSLMGVFMLSPVLTLGIFENASLPLFLLCSIFFGVLLGLISGGIVALWRVNATLPSLFAGALYVVIAVINYKKITFSVQYKPEDVGLAVLCVALMLLVVCFIFKRTVLGYNFRALSQDPYVARRLGVSVRYVRIATHTVSGALMGAVGALVAATDVNPLEIGAVALGALLSVLAYFVNKHNKLPRARRAKGHFDDNEKNPEKNQKRY